MRLIFLALLISTAAAADELSVCYNYSCREQALVTFKLRELKTLKSILKASSDAAAERAAIARALGQMRVFAGEQSPTYRDKGENIYDDELDGRMDCIDHASNSTTYLRLLVKRGWLKHHRVIEPVMRAPLFLDVHWAAAIEENLTGAKFAVDSWFFDHGAPADIFPLDAWLAGARP